MTWAFSVFFFWSLLVPFRLCRAKNTFVLPFDDVIENSLTCVIAKPSLKNYK